MSTGKSIRWLKLLIAILLLPACVGVTKATWDLAHVLLAGSNSRFAAAFGAGYGLWLLVFVLLPKPVRTYVLGHELTHAIWALLMGARVSGLSVGKSGGQVYTSKNNWAITLAPYFFPFYAVLFMILFSIAAAIWDLTAYTWVLFFLIGLGWSFHVTFTMMVLLTVSQPDVESQGVLFSAVIIYLMNLITMTLTATILSNTLTFTAFLQSYGENTLASYAWTLDKLVGVWNYVHASWKSRS